MNRKEYETERERLYERFHNLNVFQDRLLNRTLCFTSANLRNFMPEISYGEHQVVLSRILLNKELSVLDGLYEDVLSEVIFDNLNNEKLELLKTKPAVICTCHLGSMYIINHFLSYHQIDADIILSKSTLLEMRNTFGKMQEVHNERYRGVNLSYIEADTSTSAYKILRSLRSGRSVVIYIDGNVGAGQKNKISDHYCNIRFFNKRLLVRQGAAWIASRVNVPIFRIITYRDGKQNIHMNFGDTIVSNIEEGVVASDTVMQNLFDDLEGYVRRYYDQWECWIYLHNSIDPTSFDEVEQTNLAEDIRDMRYVFNHRDFGLFCINTDYFLLSKSTYKAYQLTESYYLLLRSVAREPFNRKKFEKTFFECLHSRGVFINENYK